MELRFFGGLSENEAAEVLLPPEISASRDRLARFEREARTVGALSHPKIVAIYDVGSTSSPQGAGGAAIHFLVMELLEGETLRMRLQHGALAKRKCFDIATQVALGLAAAHAKGIVHRDLKPENIFLTSDGRVKVLDFGLAKAHAVEAAGAAVDATETRMAPAPAPVPVSGTAPGIVLGTVGYMAPEQVRGETVDHRADIFAFGAVLLEMLTGDVVSFSAGGGTVAYYDPPRGLVGNDRVAWFRRDGSLTSYTGDPGTYANPKISPDQSSLAVGRLDSGGLFRVWVYDIARDIGRLVTAPPSTRPVWSPDGTSIIALTDAVAGAKRWGLGGSPSGDPVTGPSGEPVLSLADWSRDGPWAVKYATVRDLGLDLDLAGVPLRYGHHRGHPELRALVAAEYSGLSAEQVIVTSGAAEAIFAIGAALLEPGDNVVVEHPNYPSTYEVPRGLGCEVRFLRLEFAHAFLPDLDRLAGLVTPRTRLLIFTHPNNPTGSMIPPADLERLVSFAGDRRIPLLFDETYRHLAYGAPLPAAASLGPWAISVTSMSKCYGLPGIRLGWLATSNAARTVGLA